MRLIILDWHGTLSTLGDMQEIKGFVEALHAQGDITLGNSAMLPHGEIEDWFTLGNNRDKDMLPVVERISIGEASENWWGYPADRWPELEDPSQIDEVVIVDDERSGYDCDWLAWKSGRPPEQFKILTPKQLRSLIR